MAPADDSLESLLAARASEAQGVWPAGWVERARFTERLAECSKRDVTVLSAVHVADLYLAAACAAGNQEAMSALDREIFPRVARAIASIDPSAAFADEVL